MGIMGNRLTGTALLVGLLALAGLGGANGRDTSPARTKELEESLRKARVDGKYRMLLRQIKVDGDVETYQRFKDLGHRDRREYAGHKDLPAGHWVYVAPYWYVWRDQTAVQRQKRAWGPEQATGEPDTDMAGDIPTAWASASQDGQDEWLTLEYDQPLVPTAVLVHETFNPGALVRVTAFKLDGEEVELWKGTDPTTSDNDKGVSEIPVRVSFPIARVRLYLDSANVPGWNEIDAVGLRDKEKKVHWAVAADASTTYAPPFPAATAPARPAAPADEQLRRLETEVRELRAAVLELKASVDELKKAVKEKNK
jgi:hypothetical protein